MPVLAEIVAHQGGWDELLFVAVPLVIFAGLLVLARRRVDELERDGHTLPGGIATRVDTDRDENDTAEYP